MFIYCEKQPELDRITELNPNKLSTPCCKTQNGTVCALEFLIGSWWCHLASARASCCVLQLTVSSRAPCCGWQLSSWSGTRRRGYKDWQLVRTLHLVALQPQLRLRWIGATRWAVTTHSTHTATYSHSAHNLLLSHR